MTIEEIAGKAFHQENVEPDVETFCRDKNITSSVFFDMFARYIATGYLAGRFTWDSSDAAMNVISGLMVVSPELPDFAWALFIAFDDGEYHPRTEHLTSDEVTRPVVKALMERYPTS